MSDLIWTYIPLALIISTCVGFIYMNNKNSRSRAKRSKDSHYLEREEDAQVKYTRLITMFELLSKFPITSKGTNQLQELMASIGVYTIVEQRVETARLLLTSYVILIATVVGVYFLTDELLLQVGAVLVALVFRRDFINKKLRKERLAFWEDTYRTMASLKNEYERVYSVPKAFNKTIVEDRSKLVIASIQALFKSETPNADLAYFNQNNPNQILQRFADLCFNSYYFGITISPITQVDTFTSNLDVIMRDLQIDIDLAKKEKKKFYVAEKLPLVALLITAVAPGFLTSRYPGMHYFYNGAVGYIGTIVSVGAIALGYFIASTLNDKDSPIDDTFDFEVKWFLKPKFKDFWDRRVPKYNLPNTELLRDSLSYLTPAMLKFRQVYFSLLSALAALIVSIIYVVVLSKTSVVDLGTVPQETMEYIQKNYDSPDEFAKKYVLDEELSDQEMVKEALRKEGFGDSEATVEVVSTIIMDNRKAYENATYKPLYLFIVFAVMVLGYNVPKFLLGRRKKMVNIEVQFEILVIYAITVQMMYTPLKLKDYLKRFVYISRLYPRTHLDCYIHQFNNPQFIKERAVEMSNPQYFDFMEKLYTLRSAKRAPDVFREVERKREYLFNKVYELQLEKLDNNYSFLTVIVWAVMILVVTLQVLYPLGKFSFTSFNQYGGF